MTVSANYIAFRDLSFDYIHSLTATLSQIELFIPFVVEIHHIVGVTKSAICARNFFRSSHKFHYRLSISLLVILMLLTVLFMVSF